MQFFFKKLSLPTAESALPGRDDAMPTSEFHYVNGHRIRPPFPENYEQAVFGMGCFWGVERKFWSLTGVYSTAVGYSGGITPNPTYDELCTGMTGHTEVVLIIFDPSLISYQSLVAHFWEFHNPTQGMRQGNDKGTQYRSAIYTYSDSQQETAMQSKQHYQARLNAAGLGEITTEIQTALAFYYAEDEHQQYLAKNPQGYCGVGGTGVCY